MWFMMKIRNNKDLPTFKVFGYSNLKIFFILAITSFILGFIILIFVNQLPHQCQNIMNLLNLIIPKISIIW